MTPGDHQQDVMQHRVREIHERLSMQNMSDHDLLIRLNTQSEGIAGQLARLADTHSAQANGVETRLRALEQARWMILGAAAAFGAVAGLVVQVLTGYVRHA